MVPLYDFIHLIDKKKPEFVKKLKTMKAISEESNMYVNFSK